MSRRAFKRSAASILFLLSKNKIEIQDIPIALILEQYLAYLEQRQQMDLEVASDFVAMAAQLIQRIVGPVRQEREEDLRPVQGRDGHQVEEAQPDAR